MITKFDKFILESSSKTKEQVVTEYTNKHNSDFFKKFIETFPTSQVFDQSNTDHSDYDEDEEYEDEEGF